jgi:L-asparaginase
MLTNISKKIVLLGTGGTIAGSAADADDNVGYTAAQVGVDQLLQSTPDLGKAAYAVVAEQVAQVDSKDMSFAVWRLLALRCAHWLTQSDVQGIVITHGTDTLEETAFFLRSVLPANLTACKPVVLTCAMRPASARFSDGPQNLSDAFVVAADGTAKGVLAVCAGRIHSALHVQKVHPYRLDAFDSGDVGPMGFVEEGRARWVNAQAPGSASFDTLIADVLHSSESVPSALETVASLTQWPRVEIVMNYVGANGFMVDAMLAKSANVEDPLRGLVVAATGNGTLHCDLEAALLRAQAAGVRVVLASRCGYGSLVRRSDGLIPDSQGLSPVKARVALLLELARPHI